LVEPKYRGKNLVTAPKYRGKIAQNGYQKTGAQRLVPKPSQRHPGGRQQSDYLALSDDRDLPIPEEPTEQETDSDNPERNSSRSSIKSSFRPVTVQCLTKESKKKLLEKCLNSKFASPESRTSDKTFWKQEVQHLKQELFSSENDYSCGTTIETFDPRASTCSTGSEYLFSKAGGATTLLDLAARYVLTGFGWTEELILTALAHRVEKGHDKSGRVSRKGGRGQNTEMGGGQNTLVSEDENTTIEEDSNDDPEADDTYYNAIHVAQIILLSFLESSTQGPRGFELTKEAKAHPKLVTDIIVREMSTIQRELSSERNRKIVKRAEAANKANEQKTHQIVSDRILQPAISSVLRSMKENMSEKKVRLSRHTTFEGVEMEAARLAADMSKKIASAFFKENIQSFFLRNKETPSYQAHSSGQGQQTVGNNEMERDNRYWNDSKKTRQQTPLQEARTAMQTELASFIMFTGNSNIRKLYRNKIDTEGCRFFLMPIAKLSATFRECIGVSPPNINPHIAFSIGVARADYLFERKQFKQTSWEMKQLDEIVNPLLGEALKNIRNALMDRKCIQEKKYTQDLEQESLGILSEGILSEKGILNEKKKGKKKKQLFNPVQYEHEYCATRGWNGSHTRGGNFEYGRESSRLSLSGGRTGREATMNYNRGSTLRRHGGAGREEEEERNNNSNKKLKKWALVRAKKDELINTEKLSIFQNASSIIGSIRAYFRGRERSLPEVMM